MNELADTLFLQENAPDAPEVKEFVSCETIYEKLSKIQDELNAPKDLYNEHGNFYYRNAESILQAAKPLCKKYKCLLTLDDFIQQIGDRYYVMAVARLMNLENTSEIVSVSAFAREALEQKGMNVAMITGSSSSYARKYALNGLFCIDDGQDADSQEVETMAAEDFAIRYNEVMQKLKNYDFDPHSEKVIEYFTKKTGVDTLDIGKLMLDLDKGKKVLNVLEQMLEIKGESR